MNGKPAKKIRKLLKKPDTALLVLIHKVYGEETKNMNERQVYQAAKKMYKKGLIKFKKEKVWNTKSLETTLKEKENMVND
jgi:hypothetical protein